MINHRKRKRKYGKKIYTYKDDATHLIGSKVIASDYYRDLEEETDDWSEGVLEKVHTASACPFQLADGSCSSFQFIREILSDI